MQSQRSKMRIDKMSGEMKAWIALISGLILIAGIITVYAQMPKKVEALEVMIAELGPVSDKVMRVEEKQKEQDGAIIDTKDKVQQVAHSVDKFVAVQAEQRKADEEQKALMLKLIEQMVQTNK
jgi:hypothetical protein